MKVSVELYGLGKNLSTFYLALSLYVLHDANDLVLDFHLGSGTTCAVAHKMGRRYIGIEQLNYGENDSVVRLNNVIKGDKSGISKDVRLEGWRLIRILRTLRTQCSNYK